MNHLLGHTIGLIHLDKMKTIQGVEGCTHDIAFRYSLNASLAFLSAKVEGMPGNFLNELKG